MKEKTSIISQSKVLSRVGKEYNSHPVLSKIMEETMKESIKNRISALQKVMIEKEIDAVEIMDRENLIYFTEMLDLEGATLVVSAMEEPKLICLWLDARHAYDCTSMDVIPYFFSNERACDKTVQILNDLKVRNLKVGFTRYFINIKDFLSLKENVIGIEFYDIGEDWYKIRSVKKADEIILIKKASQFLSVGMQAAVDIIAPGIKENDILTEADYAMRKAGSEGSTFRMQVLRHDRQQLMHPYAGDFVIKNNEPVVIHLGASYKGYTSKMCRTVFLGKVNEEVEVIYKVLIQAQSIAIDALKPGTIAKDVFDAVYRYIHSKGYGKFFLDTIGYGVGIRQSEFYPIISRKSEHEICENMVVDLLLPSIYKPHLGGPRITDTVLVNNQNCVRLTQFEEYISK